MVNQDALAPDGGTTRDWPIELLDVVEEYGYIPTSESLEANDDVGEEVREAVRTLHERADSEDVNVNALVLELKRINSVAEGIPTETDVEEWDGTYNLAQFAEVFGSIENAVEFAFASDTGELTIAIDEQVKEEVGEEVA